MNANNQKSSILSVVIPVHNEEATIESLLKKVAEVIKTSSLNCEVIVVNDRSSDKTVEILSALAQSGCIKLINSVYEKGKGGALRSGFDVASGEYYVMMDGDGSHRPEDLPAMFEAVQKTQGLVIASRIYGGSQEFTRIRAFGNILFTWMVGCIHNRYLSDALNGYKAFHRDIYKKFVYSATGFEIEIELLCNTLRLNRSITEIPSQELRRQGGDAKSKVVKDGFRFLFRIILEKFRSPKRID